MDILNEREREKKTTLYLGHAVLSINGVGVNASIRFGRPRLTSNEKLMLASMFHS
uniref:Uncharacterized protein n=2 Tax=Cyprinus carpio TaxID=7962 RepID=A0A8C1CHT4_CYPCA